MNRENIPEITTCELREMVETMEESDDDIKITRRIKYAADLLGIKLIDHIIVARDYKDRLQTNSFKRLGIVIDDKTNYNSLSNTNFEKLHNSMVADTKPKKIRRKSKQLEDEL